MKEIMIHSTAVSEAIVDEHALACEVGSGTVRVYATPMMVALMENAAVKCLSSFLDEGETSVGISMNTTHDAATPMGMKVSATAEITSVDRKKVSFTIVARDEKDIIGTAQHDRFIVMQDKFEAKAQGKRNK